MRTAESRIVLPTEDIPEQPISTPLDEWLCLERTGEQVVARYSAELIAAPLRQETSEAGLRLPELPPGQCLTIEQFLIQGQLHCRVHGHCSATDATMARSTAHRQWEQLALLMEMTAGYRFAPCQWLESSMVWQRWLQPRAVQLTATQSIGFGPSMPGVGVWLPAPRTLPPNYGNVLAELAGLLPEHISLGFELRGLTLDETQRRALDQLARGFAVILPTEYGVGRKIDESDDACQTLEQLLRLWCNAPSGVGLRCRVSACKPLSEAVLNQLSRAVFGEASIDDKATAALDLSQALPAGVNWPLPLPSAEVLLESGMPSRFLTPLGPLPQSGVRLGYSGQRSVRFADEDRARHCYILGATGTGKSTLLYNLIRQDIEQGVGLCLLDPHGDLSAQVLDAIPRRRLAEVVRIDPSDAERAVGLNFLACNGPRPGVQMNFVVNEILRIFERLYDMRHAGGPIFELYMRNALLLVMDNDLPGGTLMDIPRLFEDTKFRRKLLTHCRNRHVVSFWRDLAELASGDHALPNVAGYVTSKLNRFTHNPLLQPIIGQAQTSVDWRACLDSGRVVLASLPKGLLGEPDTRLLGMLIIGQLLNAALSRVDQPPAERRPFHLYIDEAHNFTTQTVAELLAEARKFGLHLTLANQHLAQVDGTVEAILGNVGSLLLFRLGVRDSESLAAYMGEALSRRELESLPDHHLAARLLVHGRPAQPFVLRTEPALLPQRSAAVQRQRRETLARVYAEHTRPVAEVEAELAQR